MPTRLNYEKGFSLVELLIAMVIILFLGVALARGVIELIRYDMRIKARQTAIQAVERWASFIESLPYNSWIISPGENSEDPNGAGGNALYCYDCAYNRAFCSIEPKKWEGWTINSGQDPPTCNPQTDQNCYYCAFMDPNYTPLGSKVYDSDEDGIIALIDPYHGNNNCKQGEQNCGDNDKKFNYPSWYLAGYLRFLPDWGQGSDDCACRLGNCRTNCRIGSGWTSWDGSLNFRVDKDCLGGLKCTYEVSRREGISWSSAPGNKVYVGMTVINYFDLRVPTNQLGKAIGIIAWYFDPIDKNYRAVTKIVFKERQD